MQKKKISQNVRLLLFQDGKFLIAAAGTFLFADLTGNLQTDPANQAGISCLHRTDKIRRKPVLLAQIRRAKLCKDRSCSLQSLHIACRQKSISIAEQPAKQIKELLYEEPGILIISFTGKRA